MTRNNKGYVGGPRNNGLKRVGRFDIDRACELRGFTAKWKPMFKGSDNERRDLYCGPHLILSVKKGDSIDWDAALAAIQKL